MAATRDGVAETRTYGGVTSDERRARREVARQLAPVEVARAALRALVGAQMRAVAQHEVVHQRDLVGHGAPFSTDT